MRPVIGIADITAWTVCHAYPRTPSKEGVHLSHLRRVFERLGAERIGRTELSILRGVISEEELGVVLPDLFRYFSA